MSNLDYRPRLSIELDPDVKARLDQHLGGVHGLQKAVITAIIEDLLIILEGPNRTTFISAIINRQVGIVDFLNTVPNNGRP